MFENLVDRIGKANPLLPAMPALGENKKGNIIPSLVPRSFNSKPLPDRIHPLAPESAAMG
jgi:hypothetical protein